jgi:pyrroline-5-carboxylate reductase
VSIGVGAAAASLTVLVVVDDEDVVVVVGSSSGWLKHLINNYYVRFKDTRQSKGYQSMAASTDVELVAFKPFSACAREKPISSNVLRNKLVSSPDAAATVEPLFVAVEVLLAAVLLLTVVDGVEDELLVPNT